MNSPGASRLQETAREIVRILRDAGFSAYWAGGCVRDRLMGRPAKDVDVATSARPEQVQGLFPKTLEIGKAFGVIQVLRDGLAFEVATFRHDLPYRDGRHPEGVAFCDAEEDAKRRDFTINGLFYDPIADRVLDYVGGQDDLRRRLIRAIGDPEARFREDHLRLLRAARFASVLEFDIEPATAEAVRRLAPLLADVSAERVQQELTRLLVESPRAGRGLALLRDLGLLAVVLPEVERLVGQEQPPAFHPEGDVFTHTVMMLDAMRDTTPELAWSVLLHDIGKPLTATPTIEADGSTRLRFNEHDSVGADLAEQILRRLKMPNDLVEAVRRGVANHMHFINVPRMRRSKLRQMAGAPTFPMELELHRLDCLASHSDLSNYDFMRRFMEELKNEPVLPPPWVRGGDILALGVPQGPRVGYWHRKAYEAQLENRFPDREALLEWLRQVIANEDGISPGQS
ncbi:MAG: CCA tRNA nucleotidyltransferase [Kiritimatiellae bacterium]|nr:CCA tRNA nucleotidyltransferase [Kiritimatiellia bacterium]